MILHGNGRTFPQLLLPEKLAFGDEGQARLEEKQTPGRDFRRRRVTSHSSESAGVQKAKGFSRICTERSCFSSISASLWAERRRETGQKGGDPFFPTRANALGQQPQDALFGFGGEEVGPADARSIRSPAATGVLPLPPPASEKQGEEKATPFRELFVRPEKALPGSARFLPGSARSPRLLRPLPRNGSSPPPAPGGHPERGRSGGEENRREFPGRGKKKADRIPRRGRECPAGLFPEPPGRTPLETASSERSAVSFSAARSDKLRKEQNFFYRQDQGFSKRFGGTLAFRVKEAQGVHRIPDKFHPQRARSGRREEIHQVSPHGEISPFR